MCHTWCNMNLNIHINFLFLELFILPLQKLRQEFRASLGKAAVSPVKEKPREIVSTEPHATSPPRVTPTACCRLCLFHDGGRGGSNYGQRSGWSLNYWGIFFLLQLFLWIFSKFPSLQFFSICHLIFRLFRRFILQTILEPWQIIACRCHATVRGSFIRFTSCPNNWSTFQWLDADQSSIHDIIRLTLPSSLYIYSACTTSLFYACGGNFNI